jgi:sec-independent protein translocase protein TatB
MFEFDFFKLLILGMIALLVLGPEKLPGLARKLGQWAGRARSVARQLRSQLEQEAMLEEERDREKKRKAEAQAKPAEPPPAATAATPTPEPAAEPVPAPPPKPREPILNLDEYAREDFQSPPHKP